MKTSKRLEIREAILIGYKVPDIMRLLDVSHEQVTRERKFLKVGKWSPNSPTNKAKVKVITLDTKLDTKYECTKCGRPTEIRNGQYGLFIACTGWPECNNTKPYVRGRTHKVAKAPDYGVFELHDKPPVASATPKPNKGFARIPMSKIQAKNRKKGRSTTPEWDWVKDLEADGYGIEFACRWKHLTNRPSACTAFRPIRKIFKENGWEGEWDCVNGMVQVGRHKESK